MQQIIYVDVLVFLNTVITFLILLTTVEISGVEAEKSRLIIGSVVGGVYSLLILAPSLNLFFIILTRFAICVSTVFITFHIRNIKKMLKCLLCFVVISFLFAGAVYYFAGIFSDNFMHVNNGYAYINISAASLILITVLLYFAVKLINKKFFRKTKKDILYKIEITYNGIKISSCALFDSGNSVKDIYTGKPVIIIQESEIKTFFDVSVLEKLRNFLYEKKETTKLPKGFRLIPVKTIAGEKILPAFSADKAEISDGDIHRIIENPCIAITADLPENEKYKALINDEIIKQVV